MSEDNVTLADFIKEKEAQGLSQDEVMVLANMKFGGQDSAIAAPPRAMEGLGPDPEMVRRYQRMLKTYTAPKTDYCLAEIKEDDEVIRAAIMEVLVDQSKTMERAKKDQITDAIMAKIAGHGGIVLPKIFYSWVRQWQWWESSRRKMAEAMSDSAVLGIICREHWHAHPQERAMLQNQVVGGQVGSGPASMFKPEASTWGG